MRFESKASRDEYLRALKAPPSVVPSPGRTSPPPVQLSTLDTTAVLMDVDDERRAQDVKWGEQNHADGTGLDRDVFVADVVRRETQDRFHDRVGTWRDILKQEVYEALAESDPVLLRAELVQVAAVAVAWVECIDRHHR